MLNHSAPIAISNLIIILGSLLVLPSCSDVTSISGEQLEGFTVTLDKRSPGINYESQPLWVINGEIITESPLQRMKPAYIDSIVILHKEAAIEAYGEKGKNGVVQIFADKRILTDLEPDSTGLEE
ncbi:hypothetical protein [Rhodohalobacter mucosus]|uniref:TonB-dependent receptor plug domain-containing protein n=1 Tax=Rhodohalobacter mucosus TaxID=2079485 RepID=A0A316TNX4_9BACT|nr:hypothetical protein [Rhodohalobacter mucosus]PWN06313.1 hypothetical protein DDZ15_10860 [Rhodohalobacter mucosus]